MQYCGYEIPFFTHLRAGALRMFSPPILWLLLPKSLKYRRGAPMLGAQAESQFARSILQTVRPISCSG